MPSMTPDELRTYIQQNFPEFYAILDKPGVFDAFVNAAQQNASQARLQAALENTQYWRTTGPVQRSWDITTFVDPAKAKEITDQYSQQINNIANQTGIKLDPTTLAGFIQQAAANRWSSSDLRNYYVYAARGVHTGQPTGEAATDFNTVKTLASDYGVPISDQTAFLWSDRLTAGSVDKAAVQGYMIEQAKSMYPSLAGAIDAGFSVKDYTQPYAQIAARELNINPDDFNLSDPKWSAPLNAIDPKTGQKTPMTLDAWQTLVRSDPKYGYDATLGAQNQAASLTTALAQKMGAI